jgi:glycine/D-amino acid oxidase-like deaminating enzyme
VSVSNSPGESSFDYAVIGAGFFGVRLALLLGGLGSRVVILERGHGVCARASYANQARVHNGYHYPRSYSTALGSHRNYERFMRELAGCVDDRFEHVYAIAKQDSYTNSYQFKRFCAELGLPLMPAPSEVRRLFEPGRIEDAFLVRESAFDAGAIRSKLTAELARRADVILRTGTDCHRIDFGGGDGATINTSRGPVRARGVFIVAYAAINHLLVASGLAPLDTKVEIAEICLVDVPNELRRRAVTVIDGGFFSIMPMPAEGCHSFTHVRYTPHLSWNLKEHPGPHPYAVLGSYPRQSRFIYMQHDAQRYLPLVARLRHHRSLFEVKTVPNQHEIDDGRPVLFRCHNEDPLCISVLGSKIDSVFELERAVVDFLDSRRR